MRPLRLKICWPIVRHCTAADAILCQPETTESDGGGEGNYLIVGSVLENNRTRKNMHPGHRYIIFVSLFKNV
jgi:hypothetical protein